MLWGMLLVACGPEHAAEREYAVEVLLGRFLGLEYQFVTGSGEDVAIRLAGEDDGRRLLVRDVLFRTTPVLLESAALPQGDLARLPAGALAGARVFGDLPLLYGDASVSVGETTIELGVDLFGGAFVMLTRLEEAVPGPRDIHDRFPAAASLASRHAFLDRPIVNEYAEVLWWALAQLWPGLERAQRSFRVLPTCDVDWPFYSRGRLLESTFKGVREVYTRRDKSLAAARVRSALAIRRGGRSVDPANTFDFIMGLSEQHGLQSAFYFMTRHADRRFDADYSIDDPWIRNLLREIAARGHEVGLHPSYTTYRDEAVLRTEVDRLRGACVAEDVPSERIGGRQHFLRWANPVTWRAWDSVGLAYDSTLGFSEAVGFRCGACYEFPVFDLEERRMLKLVERPLIAMEVSLLNHAGATPEAAAEAMRRLKETCRSVDGDFTFLWHNNHLITDRNRTAYAAVLEP